MRRAVALPNPPAPPVITTTLSSILIDFSFGFGSDSGGPARRLLVVIAVFLDANEQA
jgi:hypothetical protein